MPDWIRNLAREIRPNAAWDGIKIVLAGLFALAGILITAIMQRIHGTPYDLIGILILGMVWFFIVGVVFVMSKWRNKSAKASAATPAPPTSATQAECPYKWTHHIAETDKSNIERAVSVESCELHFELEDELPYIDFKLTLFNGSVYSISAVNPVEGSIGFRKRRLMGNIQIERGLNSLARAAKGTLVIRLQLSREEADLIRKADDPEIDYFYLNQLSIRVDGGHLFPDVLAGRLKLPDLIPLNSIEERIEALKAQHQSEIDALKSELEEERAKRTKPDITGEIREVFLEEYANGELCRKNPGQMYFDFHFIIKIYLANHGAITTIKEFKLVLRAGERSYEGETERDPEWRAWGAEGLTDIEKFNDEPLEHTRNGALWFVVPGVQAIKDKSDMELELYAIDKDETWYKVVTLPRSQWQRNPFLYEAMVESERKRMRNYF